MGVLTTLRLLTALVTTLRSPIKRSAEPPTFGCSTRACPWDWEANLRRMLNSTVRFVVLGIGVGVLALPGPTALRIDRVVGAASCSPPPGANPVVVENCSTGNQPSEWDLPGGASSASIQGFATDISVN